MYGTFLSLEEEGHRAVGRHATFPWFRALTHPPRCNRTHHREVRDLMAAILDPTSGRHWGQRGTLTIAVNAGTWNAETF